MKKIVSIAFLMLGFTVIAQNNSQEIELPNGTTFLLGKITREELQSKPYSQWLESNYEQYAADESLIRLFSTALHETELLLFLGTWCGDSKREVPRILKILDTAGFPEEKLTLVALDKRKESYKTSPGGEEKGLDIQRVPTLVLIKQGKEVNRIVERPIASWEEDLLSILSGGNYVPNYAN